MLALLLIKGATTVLKLRGSKRRRREPSRGAKGAEEGGAWEGGVPSPNGEGSGEGAVPLLRKFFDFFYLKMVSFGAFWVALPRCM